MLAQKGHKVHQRDALASWLYKVAYRVALRLSRQRAAGVTASLEEPVMVHDDPLKILAERHEQLVTDEELTALPERLRAPLVLRYLAGKTNAEVAEQLGISVAAVESRLKRAKQKLRRTLTQRGIALSTTLVSLGAASTASAQAAEPLVAKTVAVCVRGSSAAASGSVGASSASETVLKLASKEVHAMTTLKLSNVAAVVAAIICTASLGFGLRQALSQSPENQVGLRLAAAETGDAASEGEPGAATVAETPSRNEGGDATDAEAEDATSAAPSSGQTAPDLGLGGSSDTVATLPHAAGDEELLEYDSAMLEALEQYYIQQANAYEKRITAKDFEVQAYERQGAEREKRLDQVRQIEAIAARTEYEAERQLLTAKAEQMRERRKQIQQDEAVATPHLGNGDKARPHVLQRGERVRIQALGVYETGPIDQEYTIERMGTVALGPAYGRVEISGLSLEEAARAIETHLQQFAESPKVQVTRAQF